MPSRERGRVGEKEGSLTKKRGGSDERRKMRGREESGIKRGRKGRVINNGRAEALFCYNLIANCE